MRVRITRIVTWDGLAYFRVTQVGDSKRIIDSDCDRTKLITRTINAGHTIVNDTYNGSYVVLSKYE
jgi:hypothetical protein